MSAHDNSNLVRLQKQIQNNEDSEALNRFKQVGTALSEAYREVIEARATAPGND